MKYRVEKMTPPLMEGRFEWWLLDPIGGVVSRSYSPCDLRKLAAKLNRAYDFGYEAGVEYGEGLKAVRNQK
jgi:hypothetical protein